jgi:hypothetical protein
MSTTAISMSPAQGAAMISSPTLSAVSPEERLLALLVYSQTAQMNEARTSVELNAQQLEQLREQVKKALDEAREAKKDAGFWSGLSKILGGDVAAIASLVAAAAAVVATGGAGAAILATIAAAASLAADHAEELGIPAEVAMGIAIVAATASLCVGDGKALFKVSDTVKNAAKTVRLGALAAEATFEAEGAAANMVAAKYDHDAGYLRADAKQSKGEQQLVETDMDAAFDRLSAALERQQQLVESASSAQQRTSAARYQMLSAWGGAA